jgi:hypothetical protein
MLAYGRPLTPPPQVPDSLYCTYFGGAEAPEGVAPFHKGTLAFEHDVGWEYNKKDKKHKYGYDARRVNATLLVTYQPEGAHLGIMDAKALANLTEQQTPHVHLHVM